MIIEPVISGNWIRGKLQTRHQLNRCQHGRRRCRLCQYGSEQRSRWTVIERRIAGVSNDSSITRRFARFDQPRRFDSIEHGHGDIHDDDAWPHLVRGNQRLEPVAGSLDEEPGILEDARQHITNVTVVIHHEHRMRALSASAASTV